MDMPFELGVFANEFRKGVGTGRGTNLFSKGNYKRSMVRETLSIVSLRGAQDMRPDMQFDKKITRTKNPAPVNSGAGFGGNVKMGGHGLGDLSPSGQDLPPCSKTLA